MKTNSFGNKLPTMAEAIDEYAKTLVELHMGDTNVCYLYNGMPYEKNTAELKGGAVHLRDWDCMFGDKPKSVLTADQMDKLVEWWKGVKR